MFYCNIVGETSAGVHQGSIVNSNSVLDLAHQNYQHKLIYKSIVDHNYFNHASSKYQRDILIKYGRVVGGNFLLGLKEERAQNRISI